MPDSSGSARGGLGTDSKFRSLSVMDPACRKHGKACGTQIVELTSDCASQAFAAGYTFAVLASDVFLLWKWSERARELVSVFKKK